jgi:hypothetical protein
MLGWIGGAIVGFSCGLVVFITMAVIGQEPSTAYLFQASPVILTVMCIEKPTVAGMVSGLLYKIISRKNVHVAVCLSALVIPIVNTAIYLIGIVLMKEHAATFMGLTNSSASVVFSVVFGLIWLNFVLEMIINVIFTPMIYRVIRVLKINSES